MEERDQWKIHMEWSFLILQITPQKNLNSESAPIKVLKITPPLAFKADFPGDI